MGLSYGGGAADPGKSDISSRLFWTATTVYEQIISQNPFDLMFREVLFIPGLLTSTGAN